MARTLFVSVLLALALTACGKKEEAAPAPAASTPAPAAAPAEAPVAPAEAPAASKS